MISIPPQIPAKSAHPSCDFFKPSGPLYADHVLLDIGPLNLGSYTYYTGVLPCNSKAE